MFHEFCDASLNRQGECVIITSSGSLVSASISSSCLFFSEPPLRSCAQKDPVGKLTDLWHFDVGQRHQARNALHSGRARPAGHLHPGHAVLLLLVLRDRRRQRLQASTTSLKRVRQTFGEFFFFFFTVKQTRDHLLTSRWL